MADSTPSPSAEDLTDTCPECGTTITPVEFDLMGVTRRLPGHCPVCTPQQQAEEAARQASAEFNKRKEPYQKHLPFDDPRYDGVTMDNFERREGAVKAQGLVSRFVAQLPKPDPSGLLIFGTKGNGKTRLAAAAAIRADQLHMTVAWINGKEWLRKIGEMKNEDRGYQIDLASKADMLVIDDLGGGKMTDARPEWLFTVIDAYYRKNKPVIVTTNYSPDRLVFRLSPPQKPDEDEQDTLDGERIMSRLAEMCAFVPNTAPDYRMEQAMKRAQALQGGEQADAG